MSVPTEGQAGAVRPCQPYRTGHAVYVVIASPDFRPQRPWTWPDSFIAGELVAKNLPMSQAIGYAVAHNKRQLRLCQEGSWDHRWAIAARHLKHRHARLRRRQGGAA